MPTIPRSAWCPACEVNLLPGDEFTQCFKQANLPSRGSQPAKTEKDDLFEVIAQYASQAIVVSFRQSPSTDDTTLQIQKFFYQLISMPQQHKNYQMIALVEAIQGLLGGKTTTPSSLQFEGEYAKCWNKINQFAQTYPLYRQIRVPLDVQDLTHNIRVCETALRILERPSNSEMWAHFHHVLADALSVYQSDNYAKNLEKAISHYETALQVYTRQNHPQDWANIQDSLGSAYADRIIGEKADNIEKAFNYYKLAQEIYTRERFPQEWAGTENNIGHLYFERIAGNRYHNLERAIHHLLQALNGQEANSTGWALTQNALGNAYFERGKEHNNHTDIEQAAKHYNMALQVYSQTKTPFDWALIQHNLGGCYVKLNSGEETENNTEKAIQYYKNSLQIRNKQSTPIDWAQTQMNLGAAYRQRIRGERNENLQQAIIHYRNALEIFSFELYPLKFIGLMHNIGNLFFEMENWEEAFNSYHLGIDAGDRLLDEAYTQAGRENVVSMTSGIYQPAVYCLFQLKRLQEALLLSEKGKTRLFLSAIVSDWSLAKMKQSG